MSAASFPAFDSLAASYDERWSRTPAGLLQRGAVWRQLDLLVKPGDRVLDLGCGTGEDAVHFAGLGASVAAFDASYAMAACARAKGVNARVMRVEDIGELPDRYDLAVSNFGVLNCVRDLADLRESLARAVLPGGHLAICLMGRFCLWESVYYALRGQFRKAIRRWFGVTTASLGLRVYYPLIRQVRSALAPFCALH